MDRTADTRLLETDSFMRLDANSKILATAILALPVERQKLLVQALTEIVGRSPRFLRPTLEEVRTYCLERTNGIDPQQWYDHYTANGWKVGRNAMRCWRAAVRTWEKNRINGKDDLFASARRFAERGNDEK